MNKNKIHSGSKFFRYIEDKDEPEVIRIRNIDYKKDIVKYFDEDGNKKDMRYNDLITNYRMLSPDALISFSTVISGGTHDVIVALKVMPKNTNDLKSMNETPDVICRQMVSDFFTNNLVKEENVTYLGVSVSKSTCPVDIDFNFLLACTSLTYSRMVAAYLDDTLEDILSVFDNSIFDKVLESIYIVFGENESYRGVVKTLKELLNNNNFMYDFRKCFNIMEVPYTIDDELEGLDPYNQLFLENELKVNIMETYLIRYTKEINLNKIKRDYVLVTCAQDNHSKVYIVGYDKFDGEYVPRTMV